VSPERLAALGAFLSGVASVVTAGWFVRRQKKQAKADCDQRLAEYQQALHEGLDIGKERGGSDRQPG